MPMLVLPISAVWSMFINGTIFNIMAEKTNLRGSITVRLTSCLFCLDSAALLMLNWQKIYLLGQIQTRGQLYSATSPSGE